MRRPIVTVDGVTVDDLSGELRAVVLLMGLMVSCLLVWLVLTEVSLSVSKNHGPQPDKFPTANDANVTEVDH